MFDTSIQKIGTIYCKFCLNIINHYYNSDNGIPNLKLHRLNIILV